MSPRVAAALTLAGIVLAAVALWGVLGQQIEVPTVFGDELIHWDASRSLASGDGLRVRDGGYGFGPVYPALLAPVHLLAADDLAAYRWARLLNAVLFALAAVPAFFRAEWVVAPRDIELDGEVAAEGTVAGLRLWHVRGPVRVVGGAQP